MARRSGASDPEGAADPEAAGDPERGGRPSWGVQTSLFQTREPAFWLYLLLLLVAGALTLRQQRDLEAASPSGWALSWALLALYLLPMVAVIYLLDLYEREPPSLVVGALLYGGVCASALAALANDGWSAALARLTGPDFAARWSPALTAPWTEELVKGCGVVLLYPGLVGIAVAWVVTRRGEQPRFRRLATAGALAAVAVAAHFLWNSPWLDLFPSGDPVGPRALVQVVVAAAVKGLPFLAVLMVMLTLARRRESHWLRDAVAAEVGGPGLLPDELEVLSDPRRRRLARRRLRRGHGRKAAATLRRLHRAQINLAMIRTRVGDDHHPDLVGQRERCRALRERLPADAAE